MVVPPASVTVTAFVAAYTQLAVSAILPASDTVGVADSDTVVTLIVSGTVVLAAAVLKARLSKVVPPDTAVMLRLVVPASM